MKPLDIIKFVESYLSGYFFNLAATFYRPWDVFFPIPDKNSRVSPLVSSVIKTSWDPKLFGFLAINVFLGTSLLEISYSKATTPNIFAVVMVTLFFWFVASSTVHLFCKAFGGQASFQSSISLGMQIFSAVYIASSFLTVIWFSLVPVIKHNGLFGTSTLISNPVYIFFIVQATLLILYIPYGFRIIHRMNRISSIFVGVFTIFLWVPVNFLIFMISGNRHPLFTPIQADNYIIVDISGSMNIDSMRKCWEIIKQKNIKAKVITFSDSINVEAISEFNLRLNKEELQINGRTEFYLVYKYIAEKNKNIDEIYLVSDLEFQSPKNRVSVIKTKKLYVYLVPHIRIPHKHLISNLDRWIEAEYKEVYVCLRDIRRIY